MVTPPPPPGPASLYKGTCSSQFYHNGSASRALYTYCYSLCACSRDVTLACSSVLVIILWRLFSYCIISEMLVEDVSMSRSSVQNYNRPLKKRPVPASVQEDCPPPVVYDGKSSESISRQLIMQYCARLPPRVVHDRVRDAHATFDVCIFEGGLWSQLTFVLIRFFFVVHR